MSNIFTKLFLVDIEENRDCDEWLLLTLTHTTFKKLGQIISWISTTVLLNESSVQWQGNKLKTFIASEIIRTSILTV